MWNDWELSSFIKLGHKENHAVCISLDWQKKQLEIAAQKIISEVLLTSKSQTKKCGFPAAWENLAQNTNFTLQITTETKRVKMDRIKYLLRGI